MDTDTLVESRIDDGRRLINQLVEDHFDVAAACWAKTAEEGQWFLYIASRAVEGTGLAAAYKDAYRVIRSMPDIGAIKSEIKLIGTENPIANDMQRYARESPTRYRGPRLGNVAIEEAYLYPTSTAQGVMFTNASEIESLLGEAVRNTATRLGVSDALFFSVDELRRQIETKDPETSVLLNAFIDAYWNWFDFHRRVEALSKQGLLDADEHVQLARLVESRNQTRQALLERLHSVG